MSIFSSKSLLKLALVGVFPDGMASQCQGILSNGERCEERRLHLSKDGLCPSCQQARNEQEFVNKGSGRYWLSSRNEKDSNE